MHKYRSPLMLGIGVSAGLIVIILATFFLRNYTFHGSLIDPAPPAPDFTLNDQSGDIFRLSDHHGKVVLLFFGYTYCPDVCPFTLSDYKYLETQLRERASDVEFVFITVDPVRDTPAILRSHLSQFSPNFTGLTGSDDALEQVYRDYGVYAEIQPPNEQGLYLVDHSTRVYVIDRGGNLRLTFPFGMEREFMFDDVYYLVRE